MRNHDIPNTDKMANPKSQFEGAIVTKSKRLQIMYQIIYPEINMDISIHFHRLYRLTIYRLIL